MKRLLPLLFSLAFSITLMGQEPTVPPYFNANWNWVDSVYRSLTPRERIGQLIMVAGFSNRGPEHQTMIEGLIRDYGIGGVAFFQGGPIRQAALVNRYQAVTKVPLLMAMDAEWGLAMRLDSTVKFPYQMALGAVQDPDLVYRMGAEIARELKETGIQMNFAPVADVNNNPVNPVINYRSFGEDPMQVAIRARAYMHGMQDQRVLATGKHFPGHGDTDTDSHQALPVINHSRERLDSIELVPFKQLIADGLSSMMIAHLSVPSLEPEPKTPTTLSKNVITNLLRNELNFNGLIVTDALNMKGVTSVTPPGQIEVRALQAGNDLLIYVEDVGLAIRGIEDAIKKGLITEADIEHRCKAILAVKQWSGLGSWKPIRIDSLNERINTVEADLLNRELVSQSLTVVQNRKNLIPLKGLDTLKIASVVLGRQEETLFQHRLGSYADISKFSMPDEATPAQFDSLMGLLKPYNLVIIGVHNMDMRAARNFGVTEAETDFIRKISDKSPTIAVIFGNPYALSLLDDAVNLAGLVVAYQETSLTMDLSAQLIFGGIGARGRLPVSAAPLYKAGDGLDTEGGIRFSYTIPEAAGMDSWFLKKKIDSIALAGIAAKAYPGCEVFAARNGKVIFQACYGTHVYESLQPVKPEDLFDMASVTKTSAPLAAIMKLYQDKKIQLDAPFSRYWTDFKGTDKKDMTVREVLAHRGGLPAWIPFWRDTRNPDGTYKPNTLQADSTARFPVRVSAGLWRYRTYDKEIYNKIKEEPILPEKKYVYSDLSFHLWPKVIEKLSGKKYETYLADNFYKPLGATTLGYNPLKRFASDRIIPTERDTFFRMEALHGYVHDEGAAMLGGVSGNAGLFGTAEDLAKLYQMYLWKGFYGGKQFLETSTLNEFTRYQYDSLKIRRGLGFDKPIIGNDTLAFNDSYPCPSASPASFGHSGYTGTFVWADPTNGLLYVFLCNRVYPTRDNNKLTDLYIRKSILEALYESIRE
jgi:beta-glucosidase-like glycosyl hydrolase/CubicO group peptidase (beta-lactamase class C family)